MQSAQRKCHSQKEWHFLIRNYYYSPFFASIFCWNYWVVFIPVVKNFSYHFVRGECENKAGWTYHRIFKDKQSIDVVFLETLQTSCAIMAKFISNELSKIKGNQVNNVNFGCCSGGRDIQYVMLKDLFAPKQLKFLVLMELYDSLSAATLNYYMKYTKTVLMRSIYKA